MCQCGKMLRQAQQLWLHMLRLYHVTSAVALVDLQVWYNATSDVALVDLLRCYHVTSDVALVDLLLWYYVMSGVALVDILLWYHVINNVVPEWLNVQLDSLATHISLSPKRCGCGPGFVNCQNGTFDSQLQVLKFTFMVGGSLRILPHLPPLKVVAMIQLNYC